MRKQGIAAFVLGVFAAMVVLAPAAAASNASYPATYTGTTSTGGGVEFDVNADGSAVIRFVARDIPAPLCGTVSFVSSGSFPISNDSFESNRTAGLSFGGTFPGLQQAQGTLSYHSTMPNCTSPQITWTATTTAPPPDTTPPNTKVTSGPPGKTHKHAATFRFVATEPGSTFQCKLDKKKWGPCKSPKTYKGLKDGKHVFKVKAADAAGNVDPTPVKRSWRVD